jgi:AcrR family transcriptional regulator
MSQQRNPAVLTAEPTVFPERGQAANAIDEQAILDAAYELLLAIGMSRLTMADIARKASISRATMYRRWPNMQAVIGALMTREFGSLAVVVPGSEVAGPTRSGLVAAIVAMVSGVRAHPLLRKIIEVDPQLLLPYLLERRGATTNLQLSLLESYLVAGIADRSIREADPVVLAQAIMLSAWSFVLTGPVLTGGDCAALDLELTQLLERYLTP